MKVCKQRKFKAAKTLDSLHHVQLQASCPAKQGKATKRYILGHLQHSARVFRCHGIKQRKLADIADKQMQDESNSNLQVTSCSHAIELEDLTTGWRLMGHLHSVQLQLLGFS
jgi:hypothetical protein